MKIGILGAMEEEIHLLGKEMTGCTSEVRGRREYINGQISGHDIYLAFSRWGKVAASCSATTLIERYGVDYLIFTGVAGGVDPDVNIGDIVIADNLVQHDMDVSFLPQMKEFEIPLLGRADFPVRQEEVEKARTAAENWIREELGEQVSAKTLEKFAIVAPRVICGTIASGDQFISDSNKILQLRQKIPNLRCVEMEGAAVAQIAYEYDIPCLVLRTISDKADDDAIIDFPRFITSVASFFTCGSVLRLLKEWD